MISETILPIKDLTILYLSCVRFVRQFESQVAKKQRSMFEAQYSSFLFIDITILI